MIVPVIIDNDCSIEPNGGSLRDLIQITQYA
jgi:hypothetical protein